MQVVFTYKLEEFEIKKIHSFCNSIEFCSIDQQLEWTKIFFKTKICYFYVQEESEIISYCQIHEKPGSARIIFGPVCCDKDIMVYSINEIINFYKKKHFFYLGIQMYYKSGFDTEYIEYKLNKNHRINYFFNTENTKASLELSLEDSLEEIFKRMRKGHKSNINKAIRMGVVVDLASDKIELDSFVDLYSKMCQRHNISDNEMSKEYIHDVNSCLNKNKLGQILIAKDNSGIIVGGAIFVYCGNTVRYFKGTSDSDRRELSILHLLIFEGIKKAHFEGFKYFDFWGYNHFADESDQISQINHFKKGFGGYYTFFAKRMNIDLIRNGYSYYKLLEVLRKYLSKLSRLLMIAIFNKS
jgi:lipid II:glycine glycyltransferase (peptidoglycan interpeptide bridge formation enzyme)